MGDKFKLVLKIDRVHRTGNQIYRSVEVGHK